MLNGNDLTSFDIEDIEVPTLDVLQQLDADEILNEDDMELAMDEELTEGLSELFF